MTKKSLMIASAVILPLTIGVMAMGIGSGHNFNSVVKDANAEITEGSITFNRATGTQIVRSNDYYYTSGQTLNGTELFVYNASNIAPGSNNVAKMCSNGDKGSVEPEIRFLSTNSGKEDFYFQSISSITMTSDSASTRTLKVFTSTNGTLFTEFGSLGVTSSGATINLDGAHYVRFTYSSGAFTVGISEITINFRCSYNPGDWDGGDTPTTPLGLLAQNNGGSGWNLTSTADYSYTGVFMFNNDGTGSATINRDSPFSGYTVTQTFNISEPLTNDEQNYSSSFSNIVMTEGTSGSSKYYLRADSALSFTISNNAISSISITIYSSSYNMTLVA